MTGRTHDLAAATFVIAAGTFLGLPNMSLVTALVTIAATLIGGVAPDIDQPTAGLWRSIPAGTIPGHIICPLLGHHRMISHSLLGMGLAGILMKVVLRYLHHYLLTDMDIIWWAFMIGFLSHLIMDSITKEGVPWLFPVPIRFGFPPLKMLRIKTGGWIENLFVFPGLFLTSGALIYSHYDLWFTFIRHGIER